MSFRIPDFYMAMLLECSNNLGNEKIQENIEIVIIKEDQMLCHGYSIENVSFPECPSSQIVT